MSRILIIDDDPEICEAVELVLTSVGHEVVSANRRREGMSRIEEFKPELLILDVMMEEQNDGFAIARELKAQGSKFPILMLSSVGNVTGYGFGTDSDMVPVAEFQEKPILPGVLIDTVNRLLAQEEENNA